MKLPDLAVERPVTITMFFWGIILLGVISWFRLPQELFPALTYPKLSIITTYENAAPEEVETLITKVIEEATGTVSGLKRLYSTSKEGTSLVIAEFEWGTKMDFAALAVREKIDIVKERLPLESQDPIVVKYNPFELPVMILSITGSRTSADLRDFSRKYIKEALEKLDGVASASITGGVDRQILIELDQSKLQAYNIPLTRIVEVLRRANLNYPAGTIEEDFYEYLIRTIGEFESVEEIGNLVVGVEELATQKRSEQLGISEQYLSSLPDNAGGDQHRFVLLSDVGRVVDTVKEKTSISRFNGQDNISISILKQAGANTIQVADRVSKSLDMILADLPDDIDITVAYDQSTFIRKSINGVKDSALQGGVLVFLVLLFFLRNLKSSIIVTTSIPISIMAALSLMYFSGITLNMMSLMGLALGIGMLVDNAIVVMENIFQLRQKKCTNKEAARQGANQMNNAITSSTLTTVCVFLPMVFVVGIAGQLFKELAYTVTFSLLASLVVALSLIPRLMHGGRQADKQVEKLQTTASISHASMERVSEKYSHVLPFVLKRRGFILFMLIVFGLASSLLIFAIDKEFMPRVDEGQFIVKVTLPTGTRLVVTDRVVRRIEDVLLATEGVRDITSNIGSSRDRSGGDYLQTLGSHQSRIVVNLKNTTKYHTADIINEVQQKIAACNLEGGVTEFLAQGSVFETAMQGSSPIVIEVKGKELHRLRTIAEDMVDMLNSIEGITEVKTSLTMPHPEIKANISKDKAAYYHLSVQDVAVTAHTALKGVVVTKFKEEGDEIDMFLRLRPEDRGDLTKLRNILITTPQSTVVPLAELAYLSRGVGPSQIERVGQQRVVFVMGDIANRSLNDIIADVSHGIEKYTETSLIGEEREEYTLELTGERQQMQESFNSLRFALLLSILLVYMIMASQFESLWQPFVIMMTLPLSAIGVVWILFLTHTAVSVVVLLGVIVLGGIVVNNGIVLIDSINELRRGGMKLEEAIFQAAQGRLRPIIMTTLTTVFGWIPMALSKQMISPLATTVIGGLTLSTFLTLFVIPLIYYSIARRRPDIAALSAGQQSSAAVADEPDPDEVCTDDVVSKPEAGVQMVDEPGDSGVGQEEEDTKGEEEKDGISQIEPSSTVYQEKPSVPGQEEKIEAHEDDQHISPLSEKTPPDLSAQDETIDTEKPPLQLDGPTPILPLQADPSAGQRSQLSSSHTDEPSGEQQGASVEKAEPEPVEKEFYPNARQRKLLDLFTRQKRVTRKEYAKFCNVSVPTAARDLKELLDHGLVQAKGPLGPGRWYELKSSED